MIDNLSNRPLVNTFLLGTDPEFVLLSADGNLVVPGGLPHAGTIGSDMGSRVVELRPAAAKSAFTLTRRLQQLLASDARLEPFRQYRWRAGAYVDVADIPLGGHVHLDMPVPPRDSPLLQALDAATARMEWLDLLPRHESQVRRAEGRYGQPSDIRSSLGHLEYRTPPSWLFKPALAFFALTLYKLTAVSPSDALCLFNDNQRAPRGRLFRFLELFRGRDVDAERCLDNLVSDGRLRKVRGDPDADFKSLWKELEF